MDFNKKINIRKRTAQVYVLLGILMIVLNLTGIVKNDELSSFGLVFLIIGIAKIRQIKKIMADSESFNERKIAENDERNVMLWTKARSLTFSVYILLSAVAVIVLSILNMESQAKIISYCLFSLLIIYWICYFILSKKY